MATAKTPKSAAASPATATTEIEEAITVQKEAIETAVKAGTEAATQGVEKAVALTREQVEAAVQAGSAAFRGYEDILQFNQANVEALVASSTVVVRGLQDLSQSFATLTRDALEESMAASKALLAAKTVKEVFDLSSTLAKSNFDKVMAESSRLTSLSAKLAEEAFAPISGRFDAAVGRLTKIAA